MIGRDIRDTINEGINAVKRGDSTVALILFEETAKDDRSPVVISCLGYCIAKERNQIQKGAELCSQALQNDPTNPIHYLNMGRIYVLAGKNSQAIRTFRRGIKLGLGKEIRAELEKMGVRKTPVVRFLGREHPLNKYIGLLLKKCHLR